MSDPVEILITPEHITYNPKDAEGAQDGLYIGRDIYYDFFNVIIGRKKSYLLFEDGVRKGYCHSGSFGMEVVRSLMANRIEKGHLYKVKVKKLDKMIKIYFSEVSEGRIWNSEYPIAKYRLEEIPKIELKRRVD